VDAKPDNAASANVTGNARLTAALGAAIFVLLFLEGLTILSVERLIRWHVFIGLLLTVFVVAKCASTIYRFLHLGLDSPLAHPLTAVPVVASSSPHAR
jgi:hypothetical protein